MEIPVLIEPTAGGFRATTGGPLALVRDFGRVPGLVTEDWSARPAGRKNTRVLPTG